MEIGTGLFLLGVHIALAAAYAAPSVTSKGLHGAEMWAIVCTVCVLIDKLFF